MAQPSSTRADRRPLALGILVAGVALLGVLIQWLPGPGQRIEIEPAAPRAAVTEDDRAVPSVPEGGGSGVEQDEVRRRFHQAALMLHAGRYEYATAALHRVLLLAPRLPEAHVNMGYAMLGLRRPKAARDFFRSAIELRPRQANAYYGLAEALEALDDLPGALGAMRSYAHLTEKEDPFLPKARAAIWEWRASLERERVAGESAEGPKATAAAAGDPPPPGARGVTSGP